VNVVFVAEHPTPLDVVGDEEPLRLQLESFLQAVARQSAPAVDGRAGLRAIELAHRVREAIESG